MTSKQSTYALLVVGAFLSAGIWGWSDAPANWDMPLRVLGFLFVIYTALLIWKKR